MSGLLINGKRVEVDGVRIVSPDDKPWAHLAKGDGRPRSRAPQFVILHKTKADDPEVVRPGQGPFGRAERVAKFWQGDPQYSGAHLVVGGDYAACLEDLVTWEAFHANQSNARAIGLEQYEELGGVVHQAVLDNTLRINLAIAEHCGIQLQVPKPGTFDGPLQRFLDGGRNLVGFFGHCHVTSSRNFWDPGPRCFEMLIAAGAEAFDFRIGEDLAVWKDRQRKLNATGRYNLVVDGMPGPATTAALKAEGYRGGVWAFGKH